MDYKEKKLSSERIFDGKIINVRKDVVLLPNGKEGYREVVEHNGGVAIALEKDDGTFFLVKQFRYGQQKVMVEFPAGKKEKGEEDHGKDFKDRGYDVRPLRGPGEKGPGGSSRSGKRRCEP